MPESMFILRDYMLHQKCWKGEHRSADISCIPLSLHRSRCREFRYVTQFALTDDCGTTSAARNTSEATSRLDDTRSTKSWKPTITNSRAIRSNTDAFLPFSLARAHVNSPTSPRTHKSSLDRHRTAQFQPGCQPTILHRPTRLSPKRVQLNSISGTKLTSSPQRQEP